MMRTMKIVAAVAATAMLATACGSTEEEADSGDSGEETSAPADDGGDDAADDGGDDAADVTDFGGAQVTITGPERDDPSIASLNAVLGEFAESVNIDFTYTGDADWEANINTQVAGGNPPSISFFPQPGKLQDFARDGFIVPLTDEVNATLDANWAEGYQPDGQFEGVQYGVPAKTDLKSLVWYVPSRFEENGYEVPTSFDELTTLMETMVADGNTPLCVGIESGQATGWPFTDWVEEMVLRLHGPDVYDGWISNEVKFDDPRIVEAMQAVLDLWTPENVFAASGSVAATAFGDNAQPLVDGNCMMHRQANFFAGFFPDGTAFADGSEGSVDVFYFPDINGDAPVLTAGIFAAAFNDDPATMAMMNYIATGEYAEKRQAAQTEFLGGGLSGYLSAAQGQDPNVYQPLEQSFLEILSNAEIARFDGSDLMPADVGAGTFWSAGTSMVNGDITAAEAAAEIQASWP